MYKKPTLITVIKILTLIGVITALLLSLYIFWWMSRLEVPSIEGFDSREIEQSTKIYDRTGEVLLYDVHGDIRRTVVPLSEISRHLRNATVAIEDAEFYQHNGIRPKRILKAVFDNITSGTGQGGSTLTQQVVKNVYLSREKTITRKVKEWILAIALEEKLTKDEILGVYLNEMPYGGTLYGAEEASKYFFGSSATDITLAEAAYLASLPQRPSYFSPHGSHKEELEKRKNFTLSKMLEYNFISNEEYRDAINEVVVFNKFKDKNIIAPHFVFYIRNYLEEQYGTDTVYKGGLKVITTIDIRLQESGEEILKRFGLENEEKFNAENDALVAIDPKTGQILSMVGSRDYFDENIDGKFNVALAHRQPGSTFKPLVYATAFEKGLTTETVLFDLQTQFSNNCLPNDFTMGNGCYSPVNYDGTFQGPITLRNALAQSVNVPAVKVLYMTGIYNVLNKVKTMGINGLSAGVNHYGLSLVLGGGEVTPLELTTAYAVFANDGIYNKNTGIILIEDSFGNILEEFEASPVRVLSEQAARNISDVLSDNVARTPAYGRRSFLYFNNHDVAAKTGTTNDFRDVWVVGYTPTLAVGVWAGNNNNSPIVKKVAGFVIAPMWRAFMDAALPFVANEKFIDPEPLPEDIQPILKGDWQSSFNTYGGAHSILHFVDIKNPLGERPLTPAINPQYSHWELPIQLWAQGASIDIQNSTSTDQQGTTEEVQETQTVIVPKNTFTILNPVNNSTVIAGKPTTVSISSGDNLTKVEYFIDGVYMGASTIKPFSLTMVPRQKTGLTTIKAIGYMALGGTTVDTITFNTR